MANPSYDLRQEKDRTWTVYDVFTGLPTVIHGLFTVDMSLEDAVGLVDHLNNHDVTMKDARRSL